MPENESRPTFTVPTEMTISLPWLRPYDEQMEKVGVQGVHVNITVPAGANIFIDASNERARVLYPDGRVLVWHRNAYLRYSPDENSWHMTWRELGNHAEPQVFFEPMTEDCDDEIVAASGYQFSAQDLEGKQDAYFPMLAALLRDPFFNPAGFPLKSGLYKDEFNSITFELNFGEDGSPASMKAVEDTLAATLDFPYRTEIEVHEDINLDGTVMPEGYYRTEVRSFNTVTGEVLKIQVRHIHQKFTVTGEQMLRLLHEGKAEILNVLQEEWPNF